MSWKTINSILGLAAMDETFCQELLKDPVKAVKQRQFVLTKEEEEKLGSISAQDLCISASKYLSCLSEKRSNSMQGSNKTRGHAG